MCQDIMKTCSKCGLILKATNEFFQRNKVSKDGLRPDCKVCCNKKEKAYRESNRKKVSNAKKVSYQKNKEHYLTQTKKYAAKNKDHLRVKSKEYIANNLDKVRQYKKDYYNRNVEEVRNRALEWNRNNPDKRRAITASARASKIDATPFWSEKEKIKILYKKARWLGKLTGLKYHVDHIIPLNGEGVCGLHVWENLQILEAIINIKKGIKY